MQLPPQPSCGSVARRRRFVVLRAALLDHKRAGNPVAVWRDGQVVWIAPEDIPVDEKGAG